MEMESLFHSIVSSLIAVPSERFFDEFIRRFDSHFDSLSASSLSQLKKNNKSSLKGELFELICFRLCQQNAFPRMGQLSHVSMFADLPEDCRQAFQLRRQDMGIDMVARTISGEWLAIQCKYRRQPKRATITVEDKKINLRWTVPWKDLSTFYSLAERTGPPGKGWDKHIVMTNALSINRQGRKGPKDISICQGSFQSIDKSVWLAAVGYQGHKLTDVPRAEINQKEEVDLEMVRAKRLATLLNKNNPV